MWSLAAMERIRNFLANLLCALGLMAVIGSVTGFFPLASIGEMYLLSPSPGVFSVSKGRETVARRFSVRIETASGREISVGEKGDGFARVIDGSFTRRNTYAGVAMFPELRQRHYQTSILYFAFCELGLAREMGLEERVRKVTIRTWSAMAHEDFDREFSVECYR